MSWEFWGLLGLGVAVVAQTAFVGLYALGRWWPHFVGRALMTKSFVLAVVLGWTLGKNFVPVDPAVEQHIGVVMVWLIAAAIVYQFSALVRQRLQARRDRAVVVPQP